MYKYSVYIVCRAICAILLYTIHSHTQYYTYTIPTYTQNPDETLKTHFIYSYTNGEARLLQPLVKPRDTLPTGIVIVVHYAEYSCSLYMYIQYGKPYCYYSTCGKKSFLSLETYEIPPKINVPKPDFA